MSALLEVKSSVIRQVQGRPAARRKLDQPDVQGPASTAWCVLPFPCPAHFTATTGSPPQKGGAAWDWAVLDLNCPVL